jgi:hypothetical protein
MNLRESSKLSSQGGANHGAQSMSDLSDKLRPQSVVLAGAQTNANRKMITKSVLNTARRRKATSSTLSLLPPTAAVDLTVMNNAEVQNVLT